MCVPACSVAQSCLTLCNLMDCNLPDSSIHVIFLARILGGLPFPPSRDLPDPGINPSLLCFLHWQADASPLSHLSEALSGC